MPRHAYLTVTLLWWYCAEEVKQPHDSLWPAKLGRKFILADLEGLVFFIIHSILQFTSCDFSMGCTYQLALFTLRPLFPFQVIHCADQCM